MTPRALKLKELLDDDKFNPEIITKKRIHFCIALFIEICFIFSIYITSFFICDCNADFVFHAHKKQNFRMEIHITTKKQDKWKQINEIKTFLKEKGSI